MEVKCEYEGCDAVFDKGTFSENLTQQGYHIGAKHASPALAPAEATAAAVKTEERVRKTDRQKMKPQSSVRMRQEMSF